MIPEKSTSYVLPDSYDHIDQTLSAAHQILSDAVDNAKTLLAALINSFNGLTRSLQCKWYS